MKLTEWLWQILGGVMVVALAGAGAYFGADLLSLRALPDTAG